MTGKARARLALGLVVLVACWANLWPQTADAHAFRPAVVTIDALPDGRFTVQVSPALDDQRQPIAAVAPVFAEHCQRTGPILDCQGRGLGTIAIAGLEQYSVDVVLRVRWRGGAEFQTVLRGGSDAVVQLPDGMLGASGLAVVYAYVVLGIQHILEGADHLLFVLGLAWVVGLRRRLLWTITAFTAAHSLSLVASTLGAVSLSSQFVEVSIALSIALMAVEVVRNEPSWTRRASGSIAFAFGLLHGLGFAGALQAVGLPPDRNGLALLGFNVGVEVGQIGIIGVAAALAWLWARRALPTRAPRLLFAYGAGVLAVAWALERLVAPG